MDRGLENSQARAGTGITSGCRCCRRRAQQLLRGELRAASVSSSCESSPSKMAERSDSTLSMGGLVSSTCSHGRRCTSFWFHMNSGVLPVCRAVQSSQSPSQCQGWLRRAAGGFHATHVALSTGCPAPQQSAATHHPVFVQPLLQLPRPTPCCCFSSHPLADTRVGGQAAIGIDEPKLEPAGRDTWQQRGVRAQQRVTVWHSECVTPRDKGRAHTGPAKGRAAGSTAQQREACKRSGSSTTGTAAPAEQQQVVQQGGATHIAFTISSDCLAVMVGERSENQVGVTSRSWICNEPRQGIGDHR